MKETEYCVHEVIHLLGGNVKEYERVTEEQSRCSNVTEMLPME